MDKTSVEGRFPQACEDEIYRGYEIEDLDRVAALGVPGETRDGFITDFFGLHTRVDRMAWTAHRGGEVLTQPPFPDDTYLAEGIEYASVGIALKDALGPDFTFVEVGAGWGPWTALMAKLAERKGFAKVTSIGIEADEKRFAGLQSHLFENGLLPSADATTGTTGAVTVHALRAAGWWREETLFFPRNASIEDAGLAVTRSGGETTDYRGQVFDHERVPAISIPDLCAPYAVVDFMHIDIQGAEWELISNAIDFFCSKVRCMTVGTHNRKIEGDLIELLIQKNWKLFREKPCRFYGMADSPTLTGLTYKDGSQLWRNMSLA
jgi:FkbM family methyltransferase